MEVTKEELKEWLESYQQLKIKAKSTYRIWERLEKEKSSLSAPADDMPKSSNKRTLEDVEVEIDARAWEYWNLHIEALKQQKEIEAFIQNLPELPQNILRLKYIEGYQWWRVARELKYSEKQLRRIRDEILESCPPMSV